MRATVVRCIEDRDITFTVTFEEHELVELPGWCRTLFSDVERFVDYPLSLISSMQSVAMQIYRASKHPRSLDTPPPLEGDLKAENKEVGSGPAGITEDVRDTIGSAPETYGAPASEGCDENGGVVQGHLHAFKSCGCKCLNIKRFEDVEGYLDDLDYKIARLETWALNVSGARDLIPRARKGEEE